MTWKITPKHLFIISLFFLIAPIMIHCQDLSNGFKEIKLGMSKDEVEKQLKNSQDFRADKEEVLIMRFEPDTQIITVEGRGFIQMGYFHFNQDKLFQIFLILSEKKIGYYTLLKRLTEKFNQPGQIDPQRAVWENKDLKIIIEKPCTIKYLYLPIWNTLLKDDLSDRKLLEQLRNDFVDTL